MDTAPTKPSYQPPSLEDLTSLTRSVAASEWPAETEISNGQLGAQINIAQSVDQIAEGLTELTQVAREIATAIDAREDAQLDAGALDSETRRRAANTAYDLREQLRSLEVKTRTVQDTVDGDPSVGTQRRIIPCAVLDEKTAIALDEGLTALCEALQHEAQRSKA